MRTIRQQKIYTKDTVLLYVRKFNRWVLWRSSAIWWRRHYPAIDVMPCRERGGCSSLHIIGLCYSIMRFNHGKQGGELGRILNEEPPV